MKILDYLKRHQECPEKITWEKFTEETRITKRDPAIYHLRVDAGFIDIAGDVIHITSKGLSYYDHTATSRLVKKTKSRFFLSVISWIAMILACMVLLYGFVWSKL